MKNLFLKIRFVIMKIRNPKATHCFFYSKKQDEIGYDFLPKNTPTFKGVRYSEMRDINKGPKNNWDDCKLLGIGTYSDVAHNLENYEPESIKKGVFKPFDFFEHYFN